MGKHYIPQFYLRGFCTGNAIQAYDRSEGRHFGSQRKSVENETAMYPQKVEDYLAQQIEDPAKPAIESIREHKPISEPDRSALANCIIAMWKRV
jgi:hypothetical protein